MQLYKKNISLITMLFCLVILCFTISACGGYTLAAKSPSIVGDGTKTLKIKEVDNPTLNPELTHNIRSAVRDEINARHLAQWVDSGVADYELSIRIESFTSREWMRDEIDVTMLYDTRLAISATVYDGATNNKIWQSGHISYSERQETEDELQVTSDIITMVARKLADQLRNTF